MKFNYNKTVADFKKVAEISNIMISNKDIHVEEQRAPHSPPSRLPEGKMAVYVFFLGEECLKVGKVGPRSHARYTSHHYDPNSSKSNLAKSMLDDRSNLGLSYLDERTIGDWIKRNTDRINFIVDSGLGIPVLTLLESFLQCRLRPRFEGFASQK